MKNLITILLLVFALSSYSQTSVDMLAFDKVNEYRISNGVSPIVFDTIIWKGVNYHSNYLIDNGYPDNYPLDNPHDELILARPSDRLFQYNFVMNGVIRECITVFTCVPDMELTTDWVIKNFDKSTPHKEAVLDPRVIRGAISLTFSGDLCYATLIVAE